MVPRFIYIFLFTACFTLTAQQYPDGRVHSLLQLGIDNLINCRYSAAEKYFVQLNTEYPDLPLSDIYLASVSIARNYDYGEEYNDSLISRLLINGKNKAEKLYKNEPENHWNIYFLALSEGYSAYFHALKEEWIPAISDGINSVDWFRKCLTYNHRFFESFTAIGTYLYWKSRKLEPFNWLPFIENETEEGIRLLEAASDSSVYSRYLAINSLIWINIDQGKYSRAIAAAENILEIYPSSRFFKRSLARALEEIDKQRSIRMYYEILNSYENPTIQNEITIKHKIAQQYHLMGDSQSALKLCREILSKNYDEYRDNAGIRSRLQRVVELRNKLLK